MTPKPLLFLFFALLFFAACKKGGTPGPLTSQVTISGTAYPTVKIGRQEWTSVNYNGPGGHEANFRVVNPNYKKYYTHADLSGLKLPSGWRIPTLTDYNKLMGNFTTKKDTDGNYVIGIEETQALRSTTDWGILYDYDKPGTNSSGFNAYPAGYYTDYPQYNETPLNLAMFLTATPLPASKANAHATHYTFIITRLYANFSSDDKTACFSCFVNGGFNNLQPKSVRFVRDF